MAPIRSAISGTVRSQLTRAQFGLTKSATRALTATSNTPASHSQVQSPKRSPLPTTALNTSLPRMPSSATQSPQSFTKSHGNPFDKLINSLTHALTTSFNPSLPELHNILRSYKSDPAHWAPYAHGNPSKHYTRNLVFQVPGVFNLLILVWTPGQASPVHDHADAHCLMKVLKGEIRETRYAMPERPGEQGALVETSCKRFGLDKVSYMADQLGLHSISNPHPSEYAVSLHLYAPPNAAMRGCHIFDEESGAAQHVMQGVYDSVEGKLAS